MKEDKDWFDKALEYQDEENYSQAIVAIEKYVDQNPDNKRGELLRAVIYGNLSLEIDPNDKSVIHCYEDILQAIKLTRNL